MPIKKQAKKNQGNAPVKTSTGATALKQRPHVTLMRHLERTFNQMGKRYMYGPDDLLPQMLIRLIANNGTAIRAVKKVAQYIYGNGFNDEAFAKMKVNERKTANKVLKEISVYAAVFEGVSLYARRNAFGEIADIDSARFEMIRPREDGSFIYNPTLGSSTYKKSADRRIAGYAGKKITSQELSDRFVNYDDPGEIVYLFQKSPFSIDFPIPSWFAGEFDVKSGSEFQAYDLENIINGFLSSVMVTFFGDIDDEQKDDKGFTEWDYYLMELKTFTGQTKYEDGLSKRGRVAAFNVGNKDEAPQVQTLALDKIIGGSIDKRVHIDKNVSMLWGVNPVLLGHDSAAILGNQQAMANASAELTRSVQDIQDMISEFFAELYPDMDTSISRFMPFQYIPDKVLEDLDSNERRKLFGYPEKKVELKSDDQVILDRLNSLPPLLATQIVQKMPSERLFKLIGLELTPEELQQIKSQESGNNGSGSPTN